MSKTPDVSIIIVNYNGKQYLQTCLDSVFAQKPSKISFEVIVVDNDSSDNSVSFIEKKYPQVVLLKSGQNLGFAGGNNLGVSKAQGRYVVLLNNDTKVANNWLQALYQTMEANPKAAAVNAKALLYYPFVQVSIESDSHLLSDFTDTIDFRQVGVAVEEVTTPDAELQKMIQYYQGFYKVEKNEQSVIVMRWTNGKGVLLLGINPDKETVRYYLTLRASKKASATTTNIRIKIGDKLYLEDTLKAQQVKQFVLELKPAELQDQLLYEVQNAGNIIFRSAHSRDRGAVVANKHHYFEIDSDYFNQPTQLQAFCGVSVMLRKDVFTKLGGFDESYFMYYEDVDMSIRMRQAGWQLLYEPNAVLYHIHAGSSGEWSPFFIFHVEKNHLAVALKFFPWHIVIQEIVSYYGLLALSIIKMWKWRVSEYWTIYEDWKEKVEARQNALRWFWSNWANFTSFRKQQKNQSKIHSTTLYSEYY